MGFNHQVGVGYTAWPPPGRPYILPYLLNMLSLYAHSCHMDAFYLKKIYGAIMGKKCWVTLSNKLNKCRIRTNIW